MPWRQILALAVLLPAMDATAADAAGPGEWRAGLARTVITPPEPTPLAGYANRTGLSEGVLQDIHLKVLALEDHRGERALLIASDHLGFRGSLTEPLCARIMAATGLPRSAILVNSSHTHHAPAHFQPSMRDHPPPHLAAIERYTRWLEERFVATAVAALDRLEPATLAFASGLVDFPVNRRAYTAQGVVLGFNPRGPVDRSVPVLRVAGPDGALRAIVFGAACHNTTLPRTGLEVAGDYAGFAQAGLEERFPGVQAMFLQGCGGDTSPYPTGTLELARRHGKTLADEVVRILAEVRFRPVRGPLRTRLATADLPLAPPPTRAEIEALAAERDVWKKMVAAQMLAALERDRAPPAHYRAPLALWQFGSDLTLAALPGEPVADYVLAVEAALGPLALWIAGYSNDVCGYLPSPRILAEGGYEARGLYSGRRFAPEVMQVVADGLRELAASADRTLPPR
jgi:hypothetical protein